MDLPAQSVERSLLTALRPIKGCVVTAWGIDAAGHRCESWCADAVRLRVTAPLSEQGGDHVKDQLHGAGVHDAERRDVRSTLPGGGHAMVDQQQITGSADDAAAEKLAFIQFDFSDAELAEVAGKLKQAKVQHGEVIARADRTGRPRTVRRCHVCEQPIPPSKWSGAKSCSESCSSKLVGRALIRRAKPEVAERRAEVERLHNTGLAHTEISTKLKVPVHTVKSDLSILRKAGMIDNG